MRIAIQDLLQELIFISEKSAQVSRLCRVDNHDLFEILIQEKTGEAQKNPRFLRDFKTFADVLIQEMAKYCLECKFPGLSKQVYGEETNLFENKLGESITVQIKPNVEETLAMLVRILDGNEVIAKSLVQIIYSSNSEPSPVKLSENISIDQAEMGIWIDPIDSTSEYINGQWKRNLDTPIPQHGLQCVTCLFGVFDSRTGIPIIGVLNQPFFQQTSDQKSYIGRCVWGFNIDGVCRNNLAQVSKDQHQSPSRLVLVGGKEKEEIKQKLKEEFEILYVAGAGYKLLTVALQHANILVSSSRSTYFWDTCAGHAILRSLGGGIIPFDNYDQTKHAEDLDGLQIKYKHKVNNCIANYNNSKGLIAYTSKEILGRILETLTA